MTFVVSGMLWNRSLVMMDQETRSLWSHILGKAMRGPLQGEQLQQIPSVMTDWQTWRKNHPNGKVVIMSRTSRNYTRNFHGRLEKFVLGVVLDGKVKAWSLANLAKKPVLNDQLGNRPLLVAFDNKSLTARLFDPRVNNRILTFVLHKGRLVDQQTGSIWDPVSGKAIAGKLQGEFLTALPGILSFRSVWKRFHPQSANY